jgi:hypothetical protein
MIRAGSRTQDDGVEGEGVDGDRQGLCRRREQHAVREKKQFDDLVKKSTRSGTDRREKDIYIYIYIYIDILSSFQKTYSFRNYYIFGI